MLRAALGLILSCASAMAASVQAPPVPAAWFGGTSIPANEIAMVGDSLMASGNFYIPASPIALTGNTHTSTLIDNLSSTAGLQVGQFFYGVSAAGIPGNDYIASITTGACPSACSLTLTSPTTATATSVSLIAQANIGSILQVGASMASPYGWLDAITGGALDWSPTAGYQGGFDALQSTVVLTPGSGYADTSTYTVGAPTGSPGHNAGNVTCSALNGAVQSCTSPATPGSGYLFPPTLTCLTGCGTGATLSFRVSGYGSFAVYGDTTHNIAIRAADLCAAVPKPTWAQLDGGSNDIAVGTSAATILANLETALSTLNGCGIRVIVFKIPSRGSWSGLTGYTTAQAMSTLERVNHGLEQLGRLAYANGLSTPMFVVIDPNRWWTDPTNSANPGYVMSGFTLDTLHPALPGAFFMAIAEKEALGRYLPPVLPHSYGQDDFYDATYNPGGNLLGTAGIFLGASGINSGTNCTGTVATGWTFSKANGSSTPGCTLSASARTDALAGEQQVITFTAATGGTTTEDYQLVDTVAGTNVNAGDRVVASCKMNLSNYVNVNRIGITLREYGQSNNPAFVQNAYGLDAQAATAGAILPAYTIIQNLPLNGILPGFVQGVSGGAFDMDVRTTVPLVAQANIGGTITFYLFVDIGYDATIAGTQFTLKVSNCAVRKLTP